MASPQTEDGYTRIANELLDAIRLARFSATEFALVLFIIRESYGWNRKTTLPMGLKTISKKTGIPRSSVQYAADSLLEKKVLKREAKDVGAAWILNKDHEQWGYGLTVPPGTEPQSPKGTASQSPGVRPVGLFRDLYKVLKDSLKTRKTDGNPSGHSKQRPKCGRSGCSIYPEKGHRLCVVHEAEVTA